MVEELRGLLKIPSVTGMSSEEDEKYGHLPYGKEVFKALNYVLELGKSKGFKVKNCENKLGYLEIGEGKELIGILAHLDVVPAGEGWDYEPFDGTEVDGVLFGRGTLDNKGPIIASIHAMKRLIDKGIPLNKRIRLILGCQEESGSWEDIKHYVKTEEKPNYGFTPDADFPAIYGERGIMNFNLSFPVELTEIEKASAGTAVNVVPSSAKIIDRFGRIYEGVGISAHGSLPQDGKNAIGDVFSKIDTKFAKFIYEKLGKVTNGSDIGCGFKDDSGELTMNLGTMKIEDENLVFGIDVRYPVSVDYKNILDIIREETKEFNGKVNLTGQKDPVFMDKNSSILKSLLSAYEEITNDKTEPYIIGGGTYARAMENIVAFGPVFPGEPCNEHMKNESISVQALYKATDIYELALMNLLKL